MHTQHANTGARALCVVLLCVSVVSVGANFISDKSLLSSLVKWDNPESDRNYFDPWKSSSFRLVQRAMVNVSFLDNTVFKGYDGQDIIQMGDYNIETRLCFITKSAGHSLDHVDGIIGFGYVDFKRSPAFLETLTRRHRPEWHITQPGKIMKSKKFSFVAGNNGGELQLGGHDPATIVGPMFYTDIIKGQPSYSVNVLSIKYGSHELLEFGPLNNTVGGLLDSGTSCMTFPSTTMDGTFEKVPWDLYKQYREEFGPAPLIINIDGMDFEIPYSQQHGAVGCVGSSPKDLILGDPFFRQYLVEFDIGAKPIRFAIGARNPDYTLVTEHTEHDEISKLAMSKHKASQRIVQPEEHTDIDHIAVIDKDNVQYMIEVGVGTPPQMSKIIFDTGSYMVAVFSRDPVDHLQMTYAGEGVQQPPRMEDEVEVSERIEYKEQPDFAEGLFNSITVTASLLALAAMLVLVAVRASPARRQRKVAKAASPAYGSLEC